MSYSAIVVTDHPPIRTITLYRPERHNAMTPEMQVELLAALEEAATGDCRVVVLTGADKAFCSGLDLSVLQAMQDRPAENLRADAERTARLFRTLFDLPVPTIAAVNGPAIAGGTGLALNCDFTFAVPAAKFGFPEVHIGFVPAMVSAFLALQAGDKLSRDLLLTGRLFEAEEALKLGLINEVVPPEKLMQRVQEQAELLIANSPQSMRATKQLIAAQNKTWLDAAMEAAIQSSVMARETADFHEGVAAFLEKRRAVWAKR